MEVVNLLNFLNTSKDLYALDYSSCEHEFVNLLDLIIEDEQFTQKIDLGVVYLKPITLERFTIVDGLSRILALSLVLHAICECYKKTTSKNESAINTIRQKYLINGNDTKLKLPAEEQTVYHKIIFGDKLSGKEKETYMFKLLHQYWCQIKSDGLQATKILKRLSNVYVVMVDINNVSQRDLYYSLNKDKRELNQLALIANYLKNIGLLEEWNNLKKILNNSTADINLFFKDFFITKFNFKEYKQDRLYELFVNYFETMLQYMSEDALISKIKTSAKRYYDILNVSLKNEELKRALIQIKIHKGEDTYPYILNIYEDYLDNSITEATFIEILQTIDEYLKNRLKTPNNVTFNELINYLNTFITCK